MRGLHRIKKLFQILKSPFFFKALLKGVAAGSEHKKILKGLTFRHIVDIGANRGQFALVARECFPYAQIDSFEPLEEARSVFENIFSGDKLTKIHPYAIGPSEGKAVIHIAKADDSSSLLPISSLQERLFPGTGEKETRIIQVLPLEHTLRPHEIFRPALLKLDVQGYELQALEGCKGLLDSFSHAYVECSFVELYIGQALADEVIAWMRDHKFRLEGIYNPVYDTLGKSVQADFLFVRTNYTKPIAQEGL